MLYGQPVPFGITAISEITPPSLVHFDALSTTGALPNARNVISTHSPFLLKLMDAKIYDLDDTPVVTKKWTELSNVLVYYNFFKQYEEEFDKK